MTHVDSVLLEIVRRYAKAWEANDVAAIFNSYHDDIVFHYFGNNPLAGTHRGKAACLGVLKQVREKTNRKLLAIRDVLAGEHFGAVIALERLERDGRVIDVERVFKYAMRDGKLAECWVLDEDQSLIDEFLM